MSRPPASIRHRHHNEEYTVIMASCQSGSISSVSCTCSHGNHDKCTNVHSFFERFFFTFSCINYFAPKARIEISRMFRGKLYPFFFHLAKIRGFLRPSVACLRFWKSMTFCLFFLPILFRKYTCLMLKPTLYDNLKIK